MTALLEVEQLTGGYGAVRVLYGLDFVVDAGEVVVILGVNGGEDDDATPISACSTKGHALRRARRWSPL
jgi:ABC-type uncharacterized transport system ATPase subunit